MGFKFEGLRELRARFEDAAEVFADAADDAAKETVEEVFKETQRRVPKKTLQLATSGRVEHIKASGYERVYAIHYGDSDTQNVGVYYAAAVHEIMDAEHPAPTSAKYVELPLIEAVNKFRSNLTEHMKRAADKIT